MTLPKRHCMFYVKPEDIPAESGGCGLGDISGTIVWAIDILARETLLFASAGFLLGGLDDLSVDFVYMIRRLFRRGCIVPSLDALPAPARPGRLAVFVPAWDESAVIGVMLRSTLARFTHPDWQLYVGCYPNDRATIDAVAAVAEDDDRVRMVIVGPDGPTTKADCLNHLWRAMRRDDARAGRTTRAVVLHDAEDVVHPDELRVYESLIGTYSVVQIPVLPLIDGRSRLVSGHYADEFAESHSRQMVVRAALGAGLPLAGVGCAIAVEALERIAGDGDAPFDATSLTEDYELGLRVASLGLPACFARVRTRPGGPLVTVRAYFPATVHAAVIQKSRWMTGIALAGWDRIGWGRPLHLSEHWMRMRDRRAPFAVLVLAVAYIALMAWAASVAAHAITGTNATPLPPVLRTILTINLALLLWRLGARAIVTTRTYGWREGLWSVPRVFVGNYIALLAARHALGRYMRLLTGGAPRWDKTAHVFPDLLAGEPK